MSHHYLMKANFWRNMFNISRKACCYRHIMYILLNYITDIASNLVFSRSQFLCSERFENKMRIAQVHARELRSYSDCYEVFIQPTQSGAGISFGRIFNRFFGWESHKNRQLIIYRSRNISYVNICHPLTWNRTQHLDKHANPSHW